MRSARTFATIVFVNVVAGLNAQIAPSQVLTRALQNPNDEGAIHEVIFAFHNEKDPAAFAQLRALFQVVTDKRLRRDLGILMFVTLGQKDDLYFNAMAKYAQDSLASEAPPLFPIDAEGNENRSGPTLAFENWCDAHQLKPEECRATAAEQGMDIVYLVMLKDRRAIPIFRRGLESDEVAIAKTSAEGLALLNDIDSIPLIVAAARRFPPKLQPLIAETLAQFDDPRAWQPIDEFIKDPKYRQELSDSIAKRLAQQTK